MDKNKRQKRFLQKERHIERQFDIAQLYDQKYYNDNNKHRLHKRHALNCGKTNCIYCMNPRKAFGEKTWQETKFYAEGIDNDE